MHIATFWLFLEDWIHEAEVAGTELMQKISKVNKNDKTINITMTQMM